MKTQADDVHVDDQLIRDAEIEELTSALRRLPEKELYLLEMKYFNQMTDGEIAAIYGIKTNSVRYYLTLARRHLVEVMSAEEVV